MIITFTYDLYNYNMIYIINPLHTSYFSLTIIKTFILTLIHTDHM